MDFEAARNKMEAINFSMVDQCREAILAPIEMETGSGDGGRCEGSDKVRESCVMWWWL